MKQRRPNARAIYCASIVALSLTACTQHAGKLKNQTNLSGNVSAESTGTGTSRIFHISKNGSRNRGALTLGANGRPTYDNLWDRLFDLYALPAVDHPDVERELNWFINHPSYIERVQQRAEPFLYSIVRHIEKQGVPGEIALLPVIESAFQAHAVSPANAAGLWQFIPTTGKRYGLKKSRSYDGRRDVYASTRAAVKYLKKLNNDFNGDWLLALAAYNCGEGAVSRAVQKNVVRGLPTDFWSLDLPQETRSYVPRLLAVSRLFVDAGQFGVDLRPIPNHALYKPIKVKSQMDLSLAATAADISLDELFALNPGFKNQYADVDGSYRLFVPADKSKGFKEELARLVQEQADSGESLMLAEAQPAQDEPSFTDFTSARESKSAVSRDSAKQPDKPRASKSADSRGDSGADKAAKVVQKLRSKSDAVVVAKKSLDGKVDKPSKKLAYTVQGGDTLYSIARRNAVTVDELMKWNSLSKNESIRPGMTLVLVGKEGSRKLSIAESMTGGIKPSQSIKYTVRQGDSIFGISKRFNVSVADLRKWNGARADKQFKPGVNLTVQAAGKD